MTKAPQMRRGLRWMMTAALLAGTAAACSGDDNAGDGGTTTDTTATTSGTSEAASGDACDMVSDEVVTAVLGIEIVRREPTGDLGSPSVSCLKGTGRATDTADFFYVSVGVVAGGGSLVDQASGEADSESVAGLGDRAVYLPSAGVLFVADGSDAVQVQVVKAGVPGSQQDTVTVANDVLERRG